MKRAIFLTSAVLGILFGIGIFIGSVLDLNVPKPAWLIFGLCSFVNAIGHLLTRKASQNGK